MGYPEIKTSQAPSMGWYTGFGPKLEGPYVKQPQRNHRGGGWHEVEHPLENLEGMWSPESEWAGSHWIIRKRYCIICARIWAKSITVPRKIIHWSGWFPILQANYKSIVEAIHNADSHLPHRRKSNVHILRKSMWGQIQSKSEFVFTSQPFEWQSQDRSVMRK